MSLNIYVDKIEDESLRYNDDHSEIGFKAKNIGFWCISTEVGEIDDVNIEEWFARYLVLRALGVNFFVDVVGAAVEISYNDLLAHRGLRTNVSTTSRASWLAQQIGGRMDDGKRDRKHAAELLELEQKTKD